MSQATANVPSIVLQIQQAQGAKRRRDRVIFALTWAVILISVTLLFLSKSKIDLGFIATWAPLIIKGAGTTIVVCVMSIVLATGLAILGALGRLSSNPVIYAVAFSLPQIGIVLPALWAGIAALALNYGAYLTEIFRAGIQAVPRGQREAAEALGLPEGLIMRRVILPQATRIVIPAIGNEFIAMIKDSALVSVIGVQETLWLAYTAGRPTGRTLEAFFIAAGVYWVLTIIFSFVQSRIERRMAKGDR